MSGTPAALTPVATFRTAYNAMLDQLVWWTEALKAAREREATEAKAA